jgi:hypothetical protein
MYATLPIVPGTVTKPSHQMFRAKKTVPAAQFQRKSRRVVVARRTNSSQGTSPTQAK